MIQKVEMYQAVCDRCGKTLLNNLRNPIVFNSKEYLEGVLSERDWREIDGHLYCPYCVEYDEETDSYKPKDKERNKQ